MNARFRAARRAHRLLRRILPHELRARRGPDMEGVFLEALSRARESGRMTVVGLWMREGFDLVGVGLRLRSASLARSWADDLQYAVRSLVRRPSLTVFAALTIGLGVGATTAIFSALESVVLNPLPYENGDRMVSLFRRLGGAGAYVPPTSDQLAAWSAQDDLLEAVEPWQFVGVTLTGRGAALELQAGLVRPRFFDMLGRTPVLGRAFDDDEVARDAPVVLLSHAMWRRLLGGSSDAIGSTLTINGEPLTIVGVLPDRTLFPGFGLTAVDVWRPLTQDRVAGAPALGVLREGVSPERVNERFASLAASQGGGSEWSGEALLVRDQVGRGLGGALGLLMGAVVMLLLIACVNVSNLLLFRAQARRLETAVRSALGGGRGRLTRQHLVESLILALSGGLLGIAIALAGQRGILRLRPERLEVLDHVSLNGRVLVFAIVATSVAGLLFGLLPALHAGRAEALAPLRSGARGQGGPGDRRARWLLLTTEVALSFALLLASLAVLDAFIERTRTEIGYDADHVAVLELALPTWRYEDDVARDQVATDLTERLAAVPGVERISRTSGVPPRSGILFGRLEVEGSEPWDGTQILHGPVVDESYFATLGQRILRGRGFTPEDRGPDGYPVVLGESTARRMFPNADPLGGRFTVSSGPPDPENPRWFTVVGVAADVAMTGLAPGEPRLQVYRPLRSGRTSSHLTLLVRGSADIGVSSLIPALRSVVNATDPDIRVDLAAVAHDLMRNTLSRERFTTTVLGTLAAFALLLAAIGLYGVVSQGVGQRTREIGIRMALGARRGSIAGLVLGSAGVAAAAGILAGGLLVFVTATALPELPLQMESHPVGPYAVAGLVLALTCLIAGYAPARRASRIDPVRAIGAD